MNTRTFLARATLFLGGIFIISSSALAATVSSEDESFLRKAAQCGALEVKMGETAAKNGKTAEIREFGRRMVRDHIVIGNDLKTLAAKKGVTLPGNLDEKHQKKVDKMAAIETGEFDTAYIDCMIKDHTKDIKVFKEQAESTKDPDVKAFIDKALPVMEEHLKEITSLKK